MNDESVAVVREVTRRTGMRGLVHHIMQPRWGSTVQEQPK